MDGGVEAPSGISKNHIKEAEKLQLGDTRPGKLNKVERE
jgi:hypothetical protein